MPKQTSTTREQLQKFMQSHIEKAAARPEPSLKISEIISTVPATNTKSSKSAMPAQTSAPARYSLRLLSPEISKINSIIHNTLEQTGERVTLTDVLRVGIGRVGETSPISRHEIVFLRASDRRRNKAKG